MILLSTFKIIVWLMFFLKHFYKDWFPNYFHLASAQKKCLREKKNRKFKSAWKSNSVSNFLWRLCASKREHLWLQAHGRPRPCACNNQIILRLQFWFNHFLITFTIHLSILSWYDNDQKNFILVLAANMLFNVCLCMT